MIKRWIKNKIKSFLDIHTVESLLASNYQEINKLDNQLKQLSEIGVDVDFHGQTQIIIISKLKGGQVRFLNVELQNMMQLEELVRNLREQFNSGAVYWDCQPWFRR